MGYELDSFDAMIILLLALSLIVITFVRDRILEFLSAAAIISLIGTELYHRNVPMVESIILVDRDSSRCRFVNIADWNAPL